LKGLQLFDEHKQHGSPESAAQNALIRRRVAGKAVSIAACSMVTLFAHPWWIADLISNLRVQLILVLSEMLLLVLLLLLLRWKTWFGPSVFRDGFFARGIALASARAGHSYNATGR